MLIEAGPPIEDGHVWTLGQEIASTTVEAGGKAIFSGRFDRVAGGTGEPRVCSTADPAPPCEVAVGFSDDGWVTVTAELVADADELTLHNLTISSFEVEQQVMVDDLHLWVCPP